VYAFVLEEITNQKGLKYVPGRTHEKYNQNLPVVLAPACCVYLCK
jgi:hypothetical protein